MSRGGPYAGGIAPSAILLDGAEAFREKTRRSLQLLLRGRYARGIRLPGLRRPYGVYASAECHLLVRPLQPGIETFGELIRGPVILLGIP